MKITVIRETHAGETRVALVPANVAKLTKQAMSVIVESGAGLRAGFSDSEYEASGAAIAKSREAALAEADIVLSLNARAQDLDELLPQLKAGQTLIGMMDPLAHPKGALALASAGVNGIAMELIPRITRAQAMDVLSSNATIAGYKAALMAANASPQLFPLMMTAAGTLKPARVFVMGAGVAGLQACATAKRLGALVEAYDIRPAAQEQILAVGAKPVELKLDTADTESAGGYAKEQSEDFIARQQAAMAEVLAQQDVVITTAAIPGKKAPVLITKAQLQAMKVGSVIIDLAAETGGNCELTELGRSVEYEGVTIIGPENIPASVAKHASQMFGTNLTNLLGLLVKDDTVNWDFDDQILADTCVSFGGQVRSPRLRELLQLDANSTPIGEGGSSGTPGSAPQGSGDDVARAS